MHRGILLSFYSSAAAFVNGKCACFLPGSLGRTQKAPEGGCSPGKKGLMILYLFVVVLGFLTLNAIAM